MTHDRLGQLARALIQPLDAVFGCVGCQSRVVADLCRRIAAAFGFPRRAENDWIAGLQGDQDLEDGCRRWIRDGDDGQDRSDRLSNLCDAANRVVRNDSHRLLIFDVVVDKLTRHGVLDHLVLPAAKTGLFTGELGQAHAIAKGRFVDRLDDAVGLVLRELTEHGGRRLGPLEVHVHAGCAGAAGLNHVPFSPGCVIRRSSIRVTCPAKNRLAKHRLPLWDGQTVAVAPIGIGSFRRQGVTYGSL